MICCVAPVDDEARERDVRTKTRANRDVTSIDRAFRRSRMRFDRAPKTAVDALGVCPKSRGEP